MRLEHGHDGLAERQIRKPNDAGRDARFAVLPAVALRRDAVDELGFADRTHRLGTVGTIHRHAFDEHGREHTMPRRGVAQNLVEHVAAARMVPQVMMRIDDRQFRLERRFSD